MKNKSRIIEQVTKGRPGVCIPITGTSKEEILAQADHILTFPCEFVEWRADYFAGPDKISEIEDILRSLGRILGDTPVIFTFRSKAEGGARAISPAEYQSLLLKVASAGLCDIIDLEVFMDEKSSPDLIKAIQKQGILVIGSHHNFEETPDNESMLTCMKQTEEMGADLIKLAVMPGSFSDVIRLMEVTYYAKTRLLSHPLITVSMGKDGLASRLCGHFTGSCLTFATAGAASAPGQINARELSTVLEIIEKNTGNS